MASDSNTTVLAKQDIHVLLKKADLSPEYTDLYTTMSDLLWSLVRIHRRVLPSRITRNGRRQAL